MAVAMSIRGSIDLLMNNEEALYEGNLRKYFKIVFTKAKNLNNPYHNFRHMMHVTWLCYQACSFYADTFNKREMRNLLIASMFHDFNHRGISGPDILNIQLAVAALKEYILPEDKPYFEDIAALIEVTEYPYKVLSDNLSLSKQIIRDADLSQSLNATWLQQVIFGLAAEWKKTPIEVLKNQVNFHRNLKLCTAWAQETWPPEEINKKIEESTQLIDILDNE